LGSRHAIVLKAAFFDGKPAAIYPDSTKAWLMLTASY